MVFEIKHKLSKFLKSITICIDRYTLSADLAAILVSSLNIMKAPRIATTNSCQDFTTFENTEADLVKHFNLV